MRNRYGKNHCLFSLGMLDLKTRAQVEQLYFSIAREISASISRAKHAPKSWNLASLLPDKYFCNFSLFQSLPDSWAIDQVFPIIPIDRLDERPDRTARYKTSPAIQTGKSPTLLRTMGYQAIFRFTRSRKTNLLHRRLLGGCLPGDIGRPAQPVWRYQRGTRVNHR